MKLVFNSFKIKSYFLYKDLIPDDLKFFLVYKFTCASCSSSYIAETCRHFKTRIEVHNKKDNKLHIFKHLHSITTFPLCVTLIIGIFYWLNDIWLLFPLCVTLIIAIFYWLNTIWLLLNLITTPMVSHLYLSSIIFILSDNNYQHLSLF